MVAVPTVRRGVGDRAYNRILGTQRGGRNRRCSRRGRGELAHSLEGVGVQADEWWDIVVCRVEGTEEVLLVLDDASACIVGGGGDNEGAGI